MSSTGNYNSCHICNSGRVEEEILFSNLCRVTSDCRPWRRNGRLGCCSSCGFVQKIIDKDFTNECKEIYRDYNVYLQSAGEEQRTFDQVNGFSEERSKTIIKKVFNEVVLPDQGRMVDIGCGNGGMLRSFASIYPNWLLSGNELDHRNKIEVEKIRGVEALYCCEPQDIPGRFDLVTMIHCLEHVEYPLLFLESISNKLTDNGYLLIEVPDFTINPFDIIVADHCTHFTSSTIQTILYASGYSVVFISSNIINKEITVLAKKNIYKQEELLDGLIFNNDSRKDVKAAITWLQDVLEFSKSLSVRGNFGLLGTSISSAWLSSELGSAVRFFIDEDEARVGKLFLGRKIYHPSESLPDWDVFLPFPRSIAKLIQARLQKYSAHYVLPPH